MRGYGVRLAGARVGHALLLFGVRRGGAAIRQVGEAHRDVGGQILLQRATAADDDVVRMRSQEQRARRHRDVDDVAVEHVTHGVLHPLNPPAGVGGAHGGVAGRGKGDVRAVAQEIRDEVGCRHGELLLEWLRGACRSRDTTNPTYTF